MTARIAVLPGAIKSSARPPGFEIAAQQCQGGIAQCCTMLSTLRLLGVFWAVSFGLVAQVPQPEPASSRASELESRLRTRLETWRSSAGFPGATFALVRRDQPTLALAVGCADREAKEPLAPTARMLAGSVGKTFVAALALRLVSAKKLELDAPVQQYLGKYPWFERLPNAATMRVRHLLDHSSGLVRYELGPEFLSAFRAEPFRKWKVEEQLAFVFDGKAPFAAGQGFEYSDTNYLVLGRIVDDLIEGTRENAIQSQLLEPLGLRDTAAQLGPRIAGLVQGYAGPEQPFGDFDAVLDDDGRLFFDPSFEGAGGGYVSNSIDLAHWVCHYFEGRAFDATLLPEVTAGREAPMLGKGVRYGLGAILREHPRLGAVQGHAGFFPGYVSEMAYYPREAIGVALQVNTSEFRRLRRPLGSMLDELVSAALEGG